MLNVQERINTVNSLGTVGRLFSAEELEHVIVYHGCPSSYEEDLVLNRCCPLRKKSVGSVEVVDWRDASRIVAKPNHSACDQKAAA